MGFEGVAAEEYRKLVALKANSQASAHDSQHRDKLAESKRREREVKDAVKAERENLKSRKEEARHEEQVASKYDRVFFGTSKQAAKDVREEKKKERRRQMGQTCEHGIWKCRICFPHETQK